MGDIVLGSVLGGRYKVTREVTKTSQGNHVYDGEDQILNRNVSVVLSTPASAGSVAESAREVALGNVQSDIQIIDLGLEGKQTYVVTNHSVASELQKVLLKNEKPISKSPTKSTGVAKAPITSSKSVKANSTKKDDFDSLLFSGDNNNSQNGNSAASTGGRRRKPATNPTFNNGAQANFGRRRKPAVTATPIPSGEVTTPKAKPQTQFGTQQQTPPQTKQPTDTVKTPISDNKNIQNTGSISQDKKRGGLSTITSSLKKIKAPTNLKPPNKTGEITAVKPPALQKPAVTATPIPSGEVTTPKAKPQTQFGTQQQTPPQTKQPTGTVKPKAVATSGGASPSVTKTPIQNKTSNNTPKAGQNKVSGAGAIGTAAAGADIAATQNTNKNLNKPVTAPRKNTTSPVQNTTKPPVNNTGQVKPKPSAKPAIGSAGSKKVSAAPIGAPIGKKARPATTRTPIGKGSVTTSSLNKGKTVATTATGKKSLTKPKKPKKTRIRTGPTFLQVIKNMRKSTLYDFKSYPITESTPRIKPIRVATVSGEHIFDNARYDEEEIIDKPSSYVMKVMAGVVGASLLIGGLGTFIMHKQRTADDAQISKGAPIAGTPVISSATILGANGNPNFEKASATNLPKAYDFDSTTAWQTQVYSSANFGGQASNLAISYKLQQKVAVSNITIQKTNSSGGNVDVYTSTTGQLDKTSKKVGSKSLSGNSVSIDIDSTPTTPYIILNITSLPQANNNYQLAISSTAIRGK
ncbi:MAG: hypothetical protein QM571_04850 [Micrococcaceae bacterium]